MRIPHEQLQQLVHNIFQAAGSQKAEAEAISDHLVQANLAGHDSHGMIRVPGDIEDENRAQRMAEVCRRVVPSITPADKRDCQSGGL